jgi:hypothetical protein
VRAGGGNFPIATAYDYRLHPAGPYVRAGPVFWPFEDAPEVLRFLHEFAPEAPDELGIALSMMRAGPLPFIAPEQRGRPVLALVLAWAGDLGEGERAMRPLRRIGTPIADVVTPIPYVALQSMLDGGAPPGRHYYWKSHRLPGTPDAVVDVLMEYLESIPTPFSQMNGWFMGGAVSRANADATAVGEREVGLDISLAVGWQPGDPGAEGHKAWSRAGWEALRPYSEGVYANFISDEGEEGVEAAYGDRRARLGALKAVWDPDNVLRMNANIAPGVEAMAGATPRADA